MKNYVFVIFVLVSLFSRTVFAAKLPDSFDMHAMPLSQVISLYFKEVSKKPYVLCDAVLEDKRLVSVRAHGRKLDSAIFHAILETNGYEVRNVSGVATVCTKSNHQQASLSSTAGIPFVYRPKFQPVHYLVDILSPLVDGYFANRRAPVRSLKVGSDNDNGASQLNTAAQSAHGDEYLLFTGSRASIKRLKSLLAQLDKPSPSVVVHAVLYEVSHNKSDGSAFKLITNLFNSHLGIKIGMDTFNNTLSIKGTDFEFVSSALNKDGRFQVVTSPFVRVRNNQHVRLQVGEDVPVQGQILINPNGQTTQSVEYHSSGVILDITARIHGEIIDLDLSQTVSNFVNTNSKSNPILNKREIKTSISVENGELIVLGGLMDTKKEKTDDDLFGIPISHSDDSTKSELVLLLQVDRL